MAWGGCTVLHSGACLLSSSGSSLGVWPDLSGFFVSSKFSVSFSTVGQAVSPQTVLTWMPFIADLFPTYSRGRVMVCLSFNMECFSVRLRCSFSTELVVVLLSSVARQCDVSFRCSCEFFTSPVSAFTYVSGQCNIAPSVNFGAPWGTSGVLG